MFLQTLGYSTTKHIKKVARNLRTNLNTFTGWKTKKIIIYFPHCRINICYLVFFVTCYGRVYVTFFPLEESGCSRQGI